MKFSVITAKIHFVDDCYVFYHPNSVRNYKVILIFKVCVPPGSVSMIAFIKGGVEYTNAGHFKICGHE